jgi:signal transduction histidine kinase
LKPDDVRYRFWPIAERNIVVRNDQRIPAYGIAVVATALAVLVRDLLMPLWGYGLPFLTFYPAVMIASWYGGLGPGLVATSLSTFAALHFFISPARPGHVQFPDILALFLFTLINMLIASLSEKLHQAIRSAETDTALLRQSEEQMRQAEQRKDEFLAILGHELRSPLNNLASALHLLKTRSDEEDVRDLSVTLLDRQIRHINGIVSDLLDISRIGQGKLQLTIELLDVNIVAKETTEDFCRSLRKDLTVSVEAPAIPLWVRGDRTRIAQMLTNLLQNAAKFTNTGGRVTVGIKPDQLRQRVVISVSDTGMGIEPELLQRLFSVYTQGDRALKRTEGGLGLGLAIVKSLAELHDGTVEALSAGKGRGSEFRVSIPLSETPSVTTSTLHETTLLASKHSQRHGTTK